MERSLLRIGPEGTWKPNGLNHGQNKQGDLLVIKEVFG